jgi:hypothetical protein
MARWPETMAGEEREGREEEDTLTNAQVLVWTAWQGRARAAGQRLLEGVFTMAPLEAPHHRRSTHAWTTANVHSKPSEEIQLGVRSVATGAGKIPSGDRTLISSKRRGVSNPLSGGGRGPRGTSYAQASAAEVTRVG